MIPRKEEIIVKLQGKKFCPVKSKRDSSAIRSACSLPPFMLQIERRSQVGLQDKQKAKDRRNTGTKLPQDHCFQLSGESPQSESRYMKDKFLPKENLLVYKREPTKERSPMGRTVVTLTQLHSFMEKTTEG